MRYPLIAIEGIDGSGKRTQAELLRTWIQNDLKMPVEIFSFPRYGTKSAGPVEEYLNGAYGKSKDISPYAASVLYAIDRFGAIGNVQETLNRSILILDRYVDSNAGHQGGKIQNEEERAKFLSWLHDLEFNILGVPRPDLTILLHLPAEVGQSLVMKKEKRGYLAEGVRDIHEDDMNHLRNAERTYMWLAERFPDHYHVVECLQGSRLLTREEIHENLKAVLYPIINKR